MIAGWLALALLGQVELRGGESAPQGRVVRVEAGGVFVATGPETAGNTATLVVTWDHVKRLEGEWAARGKQFMPDADTLWRARTRLERGDTPSAERLFEDLFRKHRGTPGATAAVVAEGLLRCRMRRGAHVLAIEPWLALLDSRDASGVPSLHPGWAADAGLTPILDEATGLVPGLPPIFVAWPSLMAWANGPDLWTPTSARSVTLGALYVAAARAEVGRQGTLPRFSGSDGGAQFVWNVVAARAGDAEQRDAARKFLRDRRRSWPGGGPAPAWARAWCHAAIGRSLLIEPELERRQQGLIELLAIPAELSTAHPYLAGLALAESASTLQALGDGTGAATLASELAERYPGHPALDWDMMRAFRRATEPAASPDPKDKEGGS
ncbi:MAG: hypothetical protein ACKVW3_10540 [Phycisphaerales bacterium]